MFRGASNKYARKNSIVIQLILVVMALLLSAVTAAAQGVTAGEVLDLIRRSGAGRGSESAPVSLIEFSDFQCSFCKTFWRETLPGIDRQYIQTGKVKFFYRHFAILGRASVAAANGAECAAEQGQFWAYHDQLFANQGGWAYTRKRLDQYAQILRLDMKKFRQCIDAEKYLKKIEGETSLGATLGARGTPTFFLNDRLLVGAQPFSVFRRAIEDELKK